MIAIPSLSLPVPIINLSEYKKGDKMTLIAGMWEREDSILLGADSASVISGTGVTYQAPMHNKLACHDTGAPLAWGVAGDDGLRGEFSAWLCRYPWPPVSFEVFQSQIQSKLASINAEQRRVMKSAGAEPTSSDVVEALIASYVSDSMRLIYVRDDSIIRAHPFNTSSRFTAIGSCGAYADLAFIAYAVIDAPADIATFKWAMVTGAYTGAKCGCAPPLHIWRITKAGIEKLDITSIPITWRITH